MDFRIVDISESGLLVETRLGLPPATVCELKFPYNGSAVSVKATVRRCRAQLSKTDSGCRVAYRSGLEFVDLEPENKTWIHDVIAEASVAGDVGGGTVTMSEEAPANEPNFVV